MGLKAGWWLAGHPFGRCSRTTSQTLGWDVNCDLRKGPDPHLRVSKRFWETSVQKWSSELQAAAAATLPIGYRGSWIGKQLRRLFARGGEGDPWIPCDT